MRRFTTVIVVGADATPAGWVCAAWDGRELEIRVVGHDPAGVLGVRPDAAVVGIDIPIGLPEEGARRADTLGRRFVGGRARSVWLTPPRAVLAAPWSPGLHVSLQAHGMRGRIFAVEQADDGRFREVHPEITFAFLNQRRPLAPKRTWEGLRQRLALLEAEGMAPPPAGAPADDVFDAVAVAWSAARIARGEAHTLPADPASGEPVIWY